jgi:hypothetical protein
VTSSFFNTTKILLYVEGVLVSTLALILTLKTGRIARLLVGDDEIFERSKTTRLYIACYLRSAETACANRMLSARRFIMATVSYSRLFS